MAQAGGAASPQPKPLQQHENDSDNEVEGPEPVEYSPGGRYGRQDLVLGRGAFKTVYKAFDEEEGTEVAWNQVRVVELVNSKEERDRLFAEIRVLKQLKHKNIMSFHDSWLDQKTMCVNFITELFTSGTLRQYRKRHRHIDEEVLKRWAWQILCGLVYLHGHTPPIIHRDLKCDNIFINGSQGVVKIGDLGLATLLRARTAPQSVLGTPEFMAPELYEEEYDDRVDVYSYGMCLLELATMEYPYAECRNAAQIYRKVTLGVRPAGLGKVASRELADFIAVCIRPKEERPRSRQLLKHPYFDSIRERATARAEALSATASQVDMFSDYASVSSSGNGSNVSRSSSVVGDADAGLVGALGPHPDGVGGGSGSGAESDDSLPPLPEPAATQTSLPDIARSSPVAAAAASGRIQSGTRELTGSLQSAVESLHTIAESLPGLLAEGSPGFARASSLHEPAEQDDLANSHPDREFRVRGKLQPDMEKLNLRLRISEPEGPAKTVEFDFDLGADTAMSVASEMVEDLSLSAEDARAIAAAIRNEIKLLTGLLNRRGDDSLASSSAGDARAGSSSPPEAEQQQSADAELQHPFDEDDADLSPPAAHSEQPPPAGDRIQPSEHPFEPGGVLRHRGGSSDDGPGFNGGVNTSCASAPDAQRERGRVSFEESSCRQHHRASFSAGSSPPSPYLRQHHGQPLGSVPALRAPSGATALSVDAAAAMAVASGRVSPGAAAEAVEAAEAASRQPGGSPRHGAGRARSRDETMGVGHGANGAGSDGGSAMSVDALDSHAFDGHAADGSQHHLSEPGMVHSSSAKTLKGLDSAELGAQLGGLVGVKRSGSGVLSPPPRAPERKVPLTKLFEDAGHITGVPQRRNGLHHSGSLPAGFSDDTVMGTSPQRSAGNSLDSGSVRTVPALGGSRPAAAVRTGLPPSGQHSSAAGASTHTHGGGGGGGGNGGGGQQHPDLGGISGGGERTHQSTATSLPAAVAGGLASLAQRLSGQ